MLNVTKKEGESAAALLYRFTKKIQQSGVLREAKKRRFKHRTPNRLKIKLSALHREAKKKEIAHNKKMGLL
jgi:ribosomal protein S21